MKFIAGILKPLASLRITVVGLTLLMILTIWGTLYQADNGLFLAQEKFYRSWFFLAGGIIPFPGAQSVMFVLFVNLMAAIVLLALRGRLQWSMLVTHIGLLMMLSAGAVTFYMGRESQLTLEEGEASNVAISYSQWELALVEPSPSGHSHSRLIHALDTGTLRPGKVVKLPMDGLSIRVESFLRNCSAIKGVVDNAPQSGSGYTSLEPLPNEKEPARDNPGMVFTLLRDGREEGRYLLWASDPNASVIRDGEASYLIGLRRARLPLPALVKLIDFRREMHPGSNIAKSYSSQVEISTGDGTTRKLLISMNKPLRLKGYTFYQSSFSSGPGGSEISTFAVVLNYGRLMPYIATGLTVAGMLLHFTGMLFTRLRRQHKNGVPA